MLSALDQNPHLARVLEPTSHIALDITASHLPLRQKHDDLIGTSALAIAFAN